MRYESSVQKKMRSLFEYLDVNNDGKITHQCLLNGLARLRNNKSIVPQSDNNITSTSSNASSLGSTTQISNNSTTSSSTNNTDTLQKDFSEYSIEELIRSVPHAADGQEGITLKTFLEAEATLLPHLTNLKLLQ